MDGRQVMEESKAFFMKTGKVTVVDGLPEIDLRMESRTIRLTSLEDIKKQLDDVEAEFVTDTEFRWIGERSEWDAKLIAHLS